MVDMKAKLVLIYLVYCIDVLVGMSITVVPSQIEASTSFELRCNVPLLASIVKIFKDGVEIGSCSTPIPGIANGVCVPSNLQQSIKTNDTVFTFNSAYPPSHNGLWKCQHVIQEAVKFITIYAFPTVLSSNKDEINETVDAQHASETEFRVQVSECVNPKPEIKWLLKNCNDSKNEINMINVKKNPYVQQYASMDCLPPQRKYTSTIKVKDMAQPVEEICFMVSASLSYPGSNFPAILSSFRSYVIFKGAYIPGNTSVQITTSSGEVKGTTMISRSVGISITVVPSQLELSTSFEVRCNIPLLAGIVNISKDGIVIGSCSPPIPGIINGECFPNNLKQSIVSNDTIFTIESANPAEHHGVWKCSHVLQETEKLITIYVFPTTLSSNQHNINESIDAFDAGDTEFRVNVFECVNPEPNINWFLRKCNYSEGEIPFKKNPVVKPYPSLECLSPQRKYTSSLKVKEMARFVDEACIIVSASLNYPETDFPALRVFFNTDIFFKAEASTLPSNSTGNSSGTDDNSGKNTSLKVYLLISAVVCLIIVEIILIVLWKRLESRAQHLNTNSTERPPPPFVTITQDYIEGWRDCPPE